MASSSILKLIVKFMKYLHDNGFKILTLKQIGYDTYNNIFYVKNSIYDSITNNTVTSSNISNTIHKTPFKKSALLNLPPLLKTPFKTPFKKSALLNLPPLLKKSVN